MRQRNVPFTVISDKKIPYGHFKLTVGNLCFTLSPIFYPEAVERIVSFRNTEPRCRFLKDRHR